MVKRCPHGKRKDSCATCNPCPHGKRKDSCVACVGCRHGKLERFCAECRPCPHGRVKYWCAECAPKRSPRKRARRPGREAEEEQAPITIRGFFGLDD